MALNLSRSALRLPSSVWTHRALLSCNFRRCHNNTENLQNNNYDIIISGGGMIGSALMCAIGSNSYLENKRVLLLERSKAMSLPELTPDYSNRVVALNSGSIDFLSEIKVWSKILSRRAKKVENMQVWDACSESYITFHKEDIAEEIAYIVENNVLLSAIAEQYQVLKSGNLSIMHEANITDYELMTEDDDHIKVHLNESQILKTKLLIGSDGANSFVRNKVNVNYISHHYDQSAIVATLRLSEDCQNDTAWQRFLPTGPVAMLPLNDHLSSLVWSTTKSECQRLLKLSDEQFVDALNMAIWDDSKQSSVVESATNVMSGFLKSFIPEISSNMQLPPGIIGVVQDSRASFPLSVGHASNYVKDGVALIGDAAHKVHPLAGQGLNLGYGDIKCLVDQLSTAVYDGSSINDVEYLRRYETIRQRHVVPTLLAIDGLKRLYSTDFVPLVLLRSIGLQVVNSFPKLKKQIISHAST